MSFGFVIRDGIESDIAACLNIDSTYSTEFVWQMSILPENQQNTITFKTERLPREMEVQYPVTEKRLRLALPPEQCFLVAAERDAEASDPLGYVTMRPDPVHGIALIQDIVVTRPLRHHRIGGRLLRVARQWALEHNMVRLMVETQTKNYPAIMFCQKYGLAFCGFNDQYFQNQDIAVFFSQSLH